MATIHPRVQVTVDPELAAALDEVDPAPRSRSRLIRDLAIRGADGAREAAERRREANEWLIRVARGEVDVDLDAAREAHEERERG